MISSRPRPATMTRLLRPVVLAILALVCFPFAAFAAYPPGPFPGPAPGGAFRTILTSAIVCVEGGSLTASDGASTIVLQVTAGAFPDCTQVTVYAADRSVIEPLLPAGNALVEAVAVGWDDSGPAAVPLSLAIGNPAISSAALAFQVTATGVKKAGASMAQAGSVTIGFSSPMGFAVTMTSTTASPTPASPPPTPPATTTTSAGGTGSGPLIFVLLWLGLACLITLVSSRPRRRSRRLR